MKRFLRWLAAAIGYLLYTALVLVLLLWVLLPAESIRLWLEGQLNGASPDLRWEVGKLEAALPAGLIASGIRLQAAGQPGQELLPAGELRVIPDLPGLLASGKELPFRYQLRILDGNLRGKGVFAAQSGNLRLEGEAEALHLDLLAPFWTSLGRTVAGRLAGRYQFEGIWHEPSRGTLSAELGVADGSVGLQQPVFGLEELEFSQLAASLALKDGVLALNGGTVESRMLTGEFSGTVSLAAPLAMSEMQLDGSIEPRSEMLAGLDAQALSLLKSQLKDNRLSFSLSGTLLEPGIKFQGVSGVIDGVVTEGGR